MRKKNRMNIMPTISELKTALKNKGLPVSGSKTELLKRLQRTRPASVKHTKKMQLNFNKLDKHPLGIFYITLYFQNPKNSMAKSWLKSQGIDHATAKHFYNKIVI